MNAPIPVRLRKKKKQAMNGRILGHCASARREGKIRLQRSKELRVALNQYPGGGAMRKGRPERSGDES